MRETGKRTLQTRERRESERDNIADENLALEKERENVADENEDSVREESE
jgi:hypothetical protein